MLYIKEDESSWTQSKKTVPLKQVRVNAKLSLFAADVTIIQEFRNDESVPVEAVYCFPVEENAAIYAFIARIDNEREIVAELKEKKAAQQEYTQALAQGHSAYLLEQDEDSHDIFIVSVGALKPGSQCHITISYVSELDLLHSNKTPTIRFVVPTTIAPRYSPSHGGIASPGGTQATYVESVPYGIEFTCQVEKFDQQVSSISSPSHPIKIDMSSNEFFFVTFTQQNIALDRDIIIDVELSDVRKNTIAAIDNGAIMISFVPSEKDCREKSECKMNEFIFIIDCSGSMNSEDKIGLARRAMLVFLASLPINCRFNIIRFGSTYTALFQNTVTQEYNHTTMSEAKQMITNMQADLGGTEILGALQWLKTNKPSTDCTRQIFLLTDGEVSNVTQVTDLCREMATHTRIFSFGLGHSPSRALVKGLAHATNGHFVFIPPNTSVDVYVAEQLDRALQLNFPDVHVKWNTKQPILHQAPEHAPPIFVGDRLLFYAVLDETVPFDHTTTVELFSGSQKQPIGSARIDHVPRIFDSQTVKRLAAKAIIRERLNTKESIDKEMLANLSIKYGILCPYTAFIGVEKRLNDNSETNADMKLREVPITIDKSSRDSVRLHTFHGPRPMYNTCDLDSVRSQMQVNLDRVRNQSMQLHRLESRAECLSYDAYSFRSARKRKTSYAEQIGSFLQPATNFISSMFTRTSSSSATARKTLPEINSSDNLLSPQLCVSVCKKSETGWPADEQKLVYRFVDLQEYDGLWKLTPEDIEQLTGKPLTTFLSSIIAKDYQPEVITTAIVIIILETKCLSMKTVWQALANKAYKRLKELLKEDETKLEQLMKDIRSQL